MRFLYQVVITPSRLPFVATGASRTLDRRYRQLRSESSVRDADDRCLSDRKPVLVLCSHTQFSKTG
jgi:hypothetical protein